MTSREIVKQAIPLKNRRLPMIQVKVNAPEEMKITVREDRAEFMVLENLKGAFVEIGFHLEKKLRKDSYVLFPACCYAGNQFISMKKTILLYLHLKRQGWIWKQRLQMFLD